jgi:hypothetical protein
MSLMSAGSVGSANDCRHGSLQEQPHSRRIEKPEGEHEQWLSAGVDNICAQRLVSRANPQQRLSSSL